jgi:flagellar basal body-associated protein FliL
MTQFEIKLRNGSNGELSPKERRMNYLVWIIQEVLAVLFLFAGGVIVVRPTNRCNPLY